MRFPVRIFHGSGHETGRLRINDLLFAVDSQREGFIRNHDGIIRLRIEGDFDHQVIRREEGLVTYRNTVHQVFGADRHVAYARVQGIIRGLGFCIPDALSQEPHRHERKRGQKAHGLSIRLDPCGAS